jgi:hypothetical protein
MRRSALLGLVLLLPGCAYVGDPTAGIGDFIGDTHSLSANPNLPVGDSENMQRVMGGEVTVPPLLTEPGDVWPGPIPPEPTLQDIERLQNEQMQQQGQPPQVPLPPGLLPPAHPQPRPAVPPPAMPQAMPPNAPGGQSMTIPNGNGTSTVIGPNGSLTTVPAP